ncbi:MAG: hypothetical protein JHC71_16910 [Blastococcus sp.]|nr:hypothetical protein [Blastococcus sp.]
MRRLLEPFFLRLVADHLLREPENAVQRAGQVIEELSRSRAGAGAASDRSQTLIHPERSIVTPT